MIGNILIGLGILLVIGGAFYFLSVFGGSASDADAGPTEFGDEEDDR